MNLYRQGGNASGDLYGVPVTNYTLGLVYNKQLFQRAGLDPNQPPTTWADVRTDAKKISALGGGIVGYGDYSAANTGGWHFTAEMYSRGGTMVNGQKAAFDNATGLQLLKNLHQMRWTDNSMGSKQLLQYNDLQQLMGSGKLGMYVGAPDNVTNIHQEYGPRTPTWRGADARQRRHAARRRRLHVQQEGHPGPDPGRHQVPQLRVPHPRCRPVQLRPGQGGRPAGRPARAGHLVRGHAVAKSTTSNEDSNANIPVSNFAPYLTPRRT